MRRASIGALVMLLMALSFGMSACESNDCMLSSESYCSMTFVDGQGTAVKLQDTLTVSSTADVVIINRKLGADGMELPLSYTASVDTFFLHYSTRLADTLWVEHQNLPYFSSMDCGTVMHYKLLGIKSTNHLIDSVRVIDSEVTNMLKKNVKIYFTVSN